MNDELLHPSSERLEAFVADDIEGGDRAVLESHLLGCPRCQAEVEEWRSLFVGLAELPQLVPAAGFADRVMAGVQVHQPWPARLAALVQRVLPNSSAGWALTAALVALPTLVGGSGAAWLFSRPWMTIEGMWLFVRGRAAGATAVLGERAFSLVLENDLVVRLAAEVSSLLSQAGMGGLGLAATLFATLTVMSAWVLYQNLIRTPTRDTHYASYCF